MKILAHLNPTLKSRNSSNSDIPTIVEFSQGSTGEFSIDRISISLPKAEAKRLLRSLGMLEIEIDSLPWAISNEDVVTLQLISCRGGQYVEIESVSFVTTQKQAKLLMKQYDVMWNAGLGT